jgi:hypothetical protein
VDHNPRLVGVQSCYSCRWICRATSPALRNKEKTIAIGGVNLINDEVHHRAMEVRDALEDEEHCYTEDGEKICCPVCGATWLEEVEGEFESGTCQHLRFTLHSECCDEFDFFGEWDPADFQDIVRRASEKDEDADYLAILEEIEHPDVNKAILYVWQDDPLYHPWMLWGYKDDTALLALTELTQRSNDYNDLLSILLVDQP